MASDYDPIQNYAERRGITFRERVVEIVRKIPEKVRGIFDGLHVAAAFPSESVPDKGMAGPERERAAADPEVAMRKARTDALVRHARAVDAIFDAKQDGLVPTVEQRRELGAARLAFEDVRPHGSQDAEAAYNKDNSLAAEAATGRIRRIIQALQLEAELRTGRDTDPATNLNQRADRFVDRWQKLGQASQHQYQAADMSGYKATRAQMGDMANGLKRDPQLESLLADRKRELGIAFDSGRRLGDEIAFQAGIDLGRGRGIGI